jgi:hypothetical protein
MTTYNKGLEVPGRELLNARDLSSLEALQTLQANLEEIYGAESTAVIQGTRSLTQLETYLLPAGWERHGSDHSDPTKTSGKDNAQVTGLKRLKGKPKFRRTQS